MDTELPWHTIDAMEKLKTTAKLLERDVENLSRFISDIDEVPITSNQADTMFRSDGGASKVERIYEDTYGPDIDRHHEKLRRVQKQYGLSSMVLADMMDEFVLAPELEADVYTTLVQVDQGNVTPQVIYNLQKFATITSDTRENVVKDLNTEVEELRGYKNDFKDIIAGLEPANEWPTRLWTYGEVRNVWEVLDGVEADIEELARRRQEYLHDPENVCVSTEYNIYNDMDFRFPVLRDAMYIQSSIDEARTGIPPENLLELG